MNLSNIKHFLKLIRWFHELLGILPFVALYLVINYYLDKSGSPCELNGGDFIILCFAVQLLMMAGFILNDIVDRDIDAINKPNTRIVGRTISLRGAWLLFIFCSLLIIVSSIYISCAMFPEWAIISPCVYVLSVAYSLYLKRSPLFGNITMGVLAGFIPLVIMFFARECLQALNNEKIYTLVWLYAAFPFLVIVPRELSLDISDMEGDRASGCKTLPLLIGAKRSKIIVALMIVFIIISSLFFAVSHKYLMPVIALVDSLLLFYLYKLRNTNTRIEYIRIGRFLWFIMILGLIGFTVFTVM